MPSKQLERLLFIQGGACFFCEKALPETEASVEHLLASALGGKNDDDNCVACCKSLNTLLGSRSLKEKFSIVLKQKGKFICPQKPASCKEPTASAELKKSEPAITPGKNHIELLISKLIHRGEARPKKTATLKNDIISTLGKQVSEAEAYALIKALEALKLIRISENKITYQLKNHKADTRK